jgi:arginine-tRNA-protein transferase
MESVFQFVASPSPCGYLPDQQWQLGYEIVRSMSPEEYFERMKAGWRRFGKTIFRPRCPACSACRSLRVLVDRFRPNRSQRRARKLAADLVRLEIGEPKVSPERLDLYDRYHAFQSEFKDWPVHEPKDEFGYANSFVENPFPTQEWRYFVGAVLVGVGYVDVLPGGMSAIYFFYDPEFRHLSLGVWNVLSILDEAKRLGVPHLYLGYYVEGCRSMLYKAKYAPNQLLGADGRWHDFQT